MKIENVAINSNIILAPMAGVTDVGFRYIAKKFGVGMTCTEMINAQGLLHGSKNNVGLLATNKNEIPKTVQLFGNKPDVLAAACKDKT